MKVIPVNQVPVEVKNVLREAILDFEESVKLPIPRNVRDQANRDLEMIKHCLNTQTWRISEVGELAAYFSRVKKSIYPQTQNPIYKQLLKEFNIILNYLNSQFDITYHDGEMIMVNEPIKDIIKKASKE